MPKKFTQILVATSNKGKFVEISKLLQSVNIKPISITDFKDLIEPEEDGSSFSENSLIKAKYYAKKTGLVALADDSGLCVVDLDNKPGIASARYAINEKTKASDFDYAFEKIFSELSQKNIDKNSKAKAFFVCNLTIYDPKDDFHIDFEGRVDGYLTYPPRGNLGFGYDPIFVKDNMDLTFGEIDRFDKDKISHRGQAFKKMVNWLGTTLAK